MCRRKPSRRRVREAFLTRTGPRSKPMSTPRLVRSQRTSPDTLMVMFCATGRQVAHADERARELVLVALHELSMITRREHAMSLLGG